MNYEVRQTSELSQGDILRGIHVVTKSMGIEGVPLESANANVMVISHDCEIDKATRKNSGTILVASVSRLDTLDKGNQGNVRKNGILYLFHLPQEMPMPIEGYVDWRTVQPVDYQCLVDARSTERYICSLTGNLYKAARERFWEFCFRPEPFDRQNEQIQNVPT